VFRYAKEYQQNAEIILFYRRFIKEILLDQSKCRRITENIVLPETVVANLNQPNTNFNSDTYLFEAASLTNTKIIVTTDEKLINQMNTVDDFKIISLIDFLESY
jgi:predicted nucleic acid-binding protein